MKGRGGTRAGIAPRLAWGLTVVALLLLGGGVIGDSFVGADEGAWFEDLALLVSFSAFPIVGALVVARFEGNVLGWILVGIGVFGGSVFVSATYAAAAFEDGSTLPGGTLAAWLANWTWYPTIQLVFPFLLLFFPTGRLVSPRWRPVLWISLGILILSSVLPMFQGRLKDEPLYNVDNPIGISVVDDAEGMLGPLFLVLALMCLLALMSLIFRFRRSRGVERLQLKWFTFAATILVVSVFLEEVFGVSGFLFSLGMIGLPIAMGIAILRYRLYEIDMIINRALVYGLLTGLAVAVYLGLVFAFQILLEPLTEDSDLVVAASTLAVAALVRPLRARIQGFIDRRFYRRKYDASRALASFATRLRDEVDLGVVQQDVLSLLDQTVQPTHAAVWLRREPVR